MRFAAFFLLPFVLGAQSASSDRLTEALIGEMQQLRLAIERSTLLGSRTQLAVTQLQVQEASVTRLQQQYNEVRSGSAAAALRRNDLADRIKQGEGRVASQANRDPMLEYQLTQEKLEYSTATAAEQERSAKEAEIASQLRDAQNRVADSRSRIADLEKALDAAIQQLFKPTK